MKKTSHSEIADSGASDTSEVLKNQIHTVLVANRGEIACRVMRTLRDAGVRSVAVYSDADAEAPHVHAADVAVHIGPSAAKDSYLVAEKIITAAKMTNAQAIHPGYGFLSENAAFARACADAGIEFIGPSAQAIDTMGDKISARAAVEARNVPTVPGLSRPGLTDEDLIEAAPSIGFPVLIKPSAGGGGKGMHRVETPQELPAALQAARREAAGAFGDDTLFLEHFVDTPRHIEVQILADKHGNVIHLGERECSLQRRHQKVIEEAPSPLLDAATRAKIGEAACDAARAVGYVGAGTVEFIVPAKSPDTFYFMEMNTRLQVEHPVTEEVTGLDLVALQLAIARGERLPISQEDVKLNGHAIEARIYAENPAADFLPTGGTVHQIVEPTGAGIRVDSGIADGSEISSLYDPMLMKIIAHGSDRAEALARLDRALAETVVAGVGVNIDFCRFLINNDDVVVGDLDTGLLDRIVGSYRVSEVPHDAYVAAAMCWLAQRWPKSGSIPVELGVPTVSTTSTVQGSALGGSWQIPDAWRIGESAGQRLRLQGEDQKRSVLLSVTGTPDRASVVVDEYIAGISAPLADGEPIPTPRSYDATIRRSGKGWHIHVDAVAQHWTIDRLHSREADCFIVSSDKGTWVLNICETAAAQTSSAVDGDGVIVAPMPGAVIALAVQDGATVEVGDGVLMVEAMKMEHTLTAEIAGAVHFEVTAGEQVTADQVLARIEPVTSQSDEKGSE